MTYRVEWSKEAELTFIQTVIQIREKWTEREVENFVARAEKVIEFIGHNPILYPYSKIGFVHRAVISKQTSLYYHVTTGNRVILLSFEDNRQNPSKLKY
jgi:plasmid stabilization system protein ParE